jgi:GNAT superfamily N-acetyltransferase
VSQRVAAACRVADGDSTELLLVLMEEFYAYGAIAYDPAVARRALAELLATPSLGVVWLVESESQPIGYAVVAFGFSLELGGRDAILDELYVREPYRGKGVGRSVLCVVEETCRERGVRALHVEVDETDERAQGFYASAGFRSRLADAHNFLTTKRL